MRAALFRLATAGRLSQTSSVRSQETKTIRSTFHTSAFELDIDFDYDYDYDYDKHCFYDPYDTAEAGATLCLLLVLLESSEEAKPYGWADPQLHW